MRHLSLLLLAACTPVATEHSTPAPPPIAAGFVLDAPVAVSPGAVLELSASLPTGAPSRGVIFVVGLGGLGAGPCVGSACLDVAAPVRVLGTERPTAGVATLTRTLPAGVPPGTYAVQAVQLVGGTYRLSQPEELVVAACGDGVLLDGETCVTDEAVELLRDDPGLALQLISDDPGWPLPVEGGLLFATDRPGSWSVAGDHNGWTPEPMHDDGAFQWLVRPAAASGGYKFTDGTTWRADPWSRQYTYDSFGELSLQGATGGHLERIFQLHATGNPTTPRTIRAWIPTTPATHVLYVHDGQNLFDPGAPWGGWQLQDAAPPGMLLVGIDNTAERIDDYTHVVDDIGGGPLGGHGDDYADFVHNTVRDVVATTWGEPATVGVMGSSLGGLISLHVAHRHAGAYDFAASLSGTVGWGSIGLNNPTIMQRYVASGLGSTVLYLDSGGGGSCFDSDADGIEDDDPGASDNFCENAQMRDALYGVGYTANVDLFHWWEPGAPHNEAAWADRVWRPLQIFSAL